MFGRRDGHEEVKPAGCIRLCAGACAAPFAAAALRWRESSWRWAQSRDPAWPPFTRSVAVMLPSQGSGRFIAKGTKRHGQCSKDGPSTVQKERQVNGENGESLTPTGLGQTDRAWPRWVAARRNGKGRTQNYDQCACCGMPVPASACCEPVTAVPLVGSGQISQNGLAVSVKNMLQFFREAGGTFLQARLSCWSLGACVRVARVRMYFTAMGCAFEMVCETWGARVCLHASGLRARVQTQGQPAGRHHNGSGTRQTQAGSFPSFLFSSPLSACRRAAGPGRAPRQDAGIGRQSASCPKALKGEPRALPFPCTTQKVQCSVVHM